MPRVLVAERAERELVDIYMKGVSTFGTAQAVRYQLDLDHCFQLLAEHPQMGRSANRIALGVRRHEHQSHVILYREIEDGVAVLAIVHGSSVQGLRL